MFVLNRWYVAAWSNELSSTPLARTLLQRAVVMFRTEDGQPVTLEDRCCHRNLPLSHGRVQGNCISCLYHGMVYLTQWEMHQGARPGRGAAECVRSQPSLSPNKTKLSGYGPEIPAKQIGRRCQPIPFMMIRDGPIRRITT